ncbi:hypothetical protein [Micropruina sonneratiae]|uniref:hypothetical protein n=1 Tax=Micropruina sonneratiae TaxID=2986940 RepID=UPI0022275A4C|nr:hypothetical protein [Micropruina sp. KQZ13P-5]MCW3157500.1 hypothetical protein [Micropruina sp. KQZ13P-5]
MNGTKPQIQVYVSDLDSVGYTLTMRVGNGSTSDSGRGSQWHTYLTGRGGDTSTCSASLS